MDKKNIQLIRKSLNQRLQSFLGKDRVDNVDCDGDEADEIQANLITAIQGSLSAREEATALRIQAALKKIELGTFGTCDDCEEPIGEKRLVAYPELPLCISCAELIEMRLKKK